MVTTLPVSAEGGVSHAIQGSSQDVSPRSDGFGQHPNRHHHGPRGHRSSPTGFVHRHHGHHHHHHHLKGPYGMIAHRHCHGDVSHGGRKHHGGPDHGLRGRHVSRGLHDVTKRGHGSHCRRRMHRSLSPHHLMQNRSSDGSRGSPYRGHKGHRGHRELGGSVPCDVNFHVVSFREHHLHLDSQEPNSGAESDHSSPLPATIEQGIELLGQLSLRSEPGPL